MLTCSWCAKPLHALLPVESYGGVFLFCSEMCQKAFDDYHAQHILTNAPCDACDKIAEIITGTADDPCLN